MPEELRHIERRKTPAPKAAPGQELVVAGREEVIEVGGGGVEEQIETLRRDKELLMMELVRLRQKQQAHEVGLSDMMRRPPPSAQGRRSRRDSRRGEVENV